MRTTQQDSRRKTAAMSAFPLGLCQADGWTCRGSRGFVVRREGAWFLWIFPVRASAVLKGQPPSGLACYWNAVGGFMFNSPSFVANSKSALGTSQNADDGELAVIPNVLGFRLVVVVLLTPTPRLEIAAQ